MMQAGFDVRGSLCVPPDREGDQGLPPNPIIVAIHQRYEDRRRSANSESTARPYRKWRRLQFCMLPQRDRLSRNPHVGPFLGHSRPDARRDSARRISAAME